MKRIYPLQAATLTFFFLSSSLFAANLLQEPYGQEELEEQLEMDNRGQVNTNQVVPKHRRAIIVLQKDLYHRNRPFWKKKSFYFSLGGSVLGSVLVFKSINVKTIELTNIRLQDVKDIIELTEKNRKRVRHFIKGTKQEWRKTTMQEWRKSRDSYNYSKSRLEKRLQPAEKSQEFIMIKSMGGLGAGCALLVTCVPTLLSVIGWRG